jgi:hypothetical protein
MKKATKTTTTPASPAPVPAKKTKSPAKPKAAVKAAMQPASAVATTIIAQIDVGFGNTLYLRGEGPGLSWEKGTVMDCVSDDKWSLTLGETERPIVFKFLVNDLTWCTGDDFVAQPGSTVTITPVF